MFFTGHFFTNISRIWKCLRVQFFSDQLPYQHETTYLLPTDDAGDLILAQIADCVREFIDEIVWSQVLKDIEAIKLRHTANKHGE